MSTKTENINSLIVLEKLKDKYKLFKISELALLALNLMIWAILGIYFMFDWSWTMILSLGGIFFVITFFILLEIHSIRKINSLIISRFLNRQKAILEDSTELLLANENELNFLARLQRNKIAEILPQIEKEIRFPNHFKKLIGFLIFSGLVAILALNFIPKTKISQANSSQKSLSKLQNTPPSILPSGVKTAQVQINAPAYTHLGNLNSANLNIKAPESSQINWNFTFKSEIKRAYLAFSDKDTLQLNKNNDTFQASKILKTKGFYSLQFIDNQGITQSSDFYTWELILDEKPKISVKGIEQYTDLQYNPHLAVQIEANLQDDYGLMDAYIIATVSKGKGESVKFREEKLNFTNTFSRGNTQAKLAKAFKLSDLGMSPGDELYFYVEASDNHQPNPQKGRTEMYFIALADTAEQNATMELGLGVNQMPDYFRSQRQLIIDTEKLLTEKNRIDKEQFQTRSNNIGVDQKILRLRYGQFLGEEFESAIGGHSHNEEEKDEHKHFEGDGHNEKDEDHKKWQERTSSLKILEKNEAEHTEKKNTSTLYGDVPESVMHIHDVQGEESFLDEALKAQLRVVLNQMWESELRLRTNRPQESLPFQYKALYLLKDIQQKSRVYVERVGFEPPPLEEKGKRLTGDVSKLQNKAEKRTYEANTLYPNLKQALAYLENISTNHLKINQLDGNLLNLAGTELAQIALEKLGFLKALKTLKQMSEGQLNEKEIQANLPDLLQKLWLALPRESPQVQQNSTGKNRLKDLYLKKIGG